MSVHSRHFFGALRLCCFLAYLEFLLQAIVSIPNDRRPDRAMTRIAGSLPAESSTTQSSKRGPSSIWPIWTSAVAEPVWERWSTVWTFPASTARASRWCSYWSIFCTRSISVCIRSPGADGAYQVNRVELIERFVRCERAEDARRYFFPAMKRILSAVEGGQRALHPLVERAKSVIDANYHRRISLSLIADRLHVSANYLSRMFRREIGITLMNYVHRVRLEHALLLLAEGGSSISEIAYRVGYQNYRDFYRNFVKYEKRSPRQAQRGLREGAANPPQSGRRERHAAESAGAS